MKTSLETLEVDTGDDPPAHAGGGDRAVMSVARVGKRFGSQVALDDLTMDVRGGEVHALVGHNGSGKSTFVRVLAGFHEPEHGGEAVIDCRPFELGDPRGAYAAGLRFVHQELGLVDTLDAVDNIVLGQQYPRHRLSRIDWGSARREARDLLASLGYQIDVRTPVGRLSHLDRTGVAIARALRQTTSQPRVLVLDEPTAALPASAVHDLFAVIRRLRADGLAILYISHHLEEIFSIADRVTVLRDGKKVTTRPVAGLSEHGLTELIIGRGVETRRRRDRLPRQSGDPVLRVRALSAGALNKVDLDVWSGEIVGVAGVAGSGREQLAGALFGSGKRGGTVVLDGGIVVPERPDRSIELGLGLLPADRIRTGLIPALSVTANLTLPRLNSSLSGCFLSRRREERDTCKWLDRLDIRPREPRKAAELLSGGNQQRVVLGRWLRARPKVLLLDEPTQGVDVGAIEKIRTLIHRYADEEGTAFVVCSSDTEALVALCSRVLVLNRGFIGSELVGNAIRRDAIDGACLMQPAPNGTNRS